jgi:hypothetical protein
LPIDYALYPIENQIERARSRDENTPIFLVVSKKQKMGRFLFYDAFCFERRTVSLRERVNPSKQVVEWIGVLSENCPMEVRGPWNRIMFV